MKNIHILPTDKPSRLYYNGTSYKDANSTMAMDWYISSGYKPQNIYITSNEEIKEGSLYLNNKVIFKADDIFNEGNNPNNSNTRVTDFNKKIILTTDVYLIKEGVQAIDDEFLEWFVMNPSYEEVEIKKGKMKLNDDGQEYGFPDMSLYKIIIPKQEQKQHLIDIMQGDEELGLYEEPKQETLEEAAEKESEVQGWGKYESDSEQYAIKQSFIRGAEWQSERMYNDGDMQEYAKFCIRCHEKGLPLLFAKDYFEISINNNGL